MPVAPGRMYPVLNHCRFHKRFVSLSNHFHKWTKLGENLSDVSRALLAIAVYGNSLYLYPTISINGRDVTLSNIATARVVRTLGVGRTPSHRVDTQTVQAACEFDF